VGKKLRLLLTISVALVVVTCASANAPIEAGNWIDPDHGWGRHGHFDRVYSTDDGGAHWHLIYDGQASDVLGIYRVSLLSGIVEEGPRGSTNYWTRDGGRHWFTSAVLPAFWGGGVRIAGHGHFLYWGDGDTLRRITPWPPTGVYARCRIPFTKPFRKLPGDTCDDGAVRDLRTSVVLQVPSTRLEDLANIPGGVIGLLMRTPAAPSSDPLARVVVVQPPKQTVFPLPAPSRTHQFRFAPSEACHHKSRSCRTASRTPS
jgi:hypothetical protein